MNRFLNLGIFLCLSSCSVQSPSPEILHNGSTTVYSGTAMTMAYKVIIGESLDAPTARSVEKAIIGVFDDTDRIFNKWNSNSELSNLNRLDAHVEVQLSPLLLRLFEETDRIVALSKGRFDPTIEPLQKLWKAKLISGQLPTNEEIARIAPAIGWNKIRFERGTFSKEHPDTMLDFGGIAKGLCIDLIVERLVNAGYSNLFVEWGGEIRARGQHPEGRPWTIFIARLNDDNQERAVATVPLEDKAIATSGDYLQNWTHTDGHGGTTTYFHIFDPRTFQPLKMTAGSIASASVMAPTCAFADGLATVALMFPTLAESQDWAKSVSEKYPDIQFWIVTRETANH